MHDDFFVPETSLVELDETWDVLCEQNPEYFDGEILHVLGVHRNGCGGATIQVVKSSYRFHAVGDVGIKPLGVNGICIWDDNYLCGFRGERVGVYPNKWEFAPSGLVEPSETPSDAMQRELEEETGLQVTVPPIAIAIFFDELARTWDIVYQLQVGGSLKSDGNEYKELGWFDVKALPKPMSPPAVQMKSLL